MKTQHTPTPWNLRSVKCPRCWIHFIESEGIRICELNGKYNSEFIIKAVNYHDDLVRTLRSLIPSLEIRLTGKSKDVEAYDLLVKARDILSKAE